MPSSELTSYYLFVCSLRYKELLGKNNNGKSINC